MWVIKFDLMDDHHDLDYFFKPQSIAIAGVSRNENSIGRKLMKNIVDFGYQGKIYPIHPKSDSIGSLPAYKRLTDIEGDVDLLISIIPRNFVLDLIEDASKKSIKAMIIVTAGFKEVSEEGEKLEKMVLQKVQEAGIRVIGPNSMGIFNGHDNLVNASFTPITPIPGDLSFISQSGAIGAVMMGYAKKFGVGFSKFISVGNKMDVNITHLLPYLANDKHTRVITCYLESFSDPKNFIGTASEISRIKPIIMVKSGKTERGSVAATSHTGALASSDGIVDVVLKKAGVVRVDSIDELIDASLIFARSPLAKGNRVAVISNAGGPGTLATDSLIENGLIVSDPSEKTREELNSFLPLEASVSNPIDILPSAGLEGYKKTLEIVLRDPNIDMVLVIFLPPVLTEIEDLFMAIEEVAKNTTKPIIGSFMGNDGDIRNFPQLSYPIYEYPQTAAKMMGYLHNYSVWRGQEIKIEPSSISAENRERVSKIIAQVIARDNQLMQGEILEIFRIYGFTMPEFRIVNSIDELVSKGTEIGYPVVVKIASKYISHKSDSGGVLLDLKNEKELKEAYEKIISIYEQSEVPLEARQVLLQNYYSDSVEIALGVTYDSQFGHMVMVGSGGVLIEILNDVQFRPVPLSRDEAKDMLVSLKGYQLLTGFRGSSEIDQEEIINSLLRLSYLVQDHPEISELDINPMFAMPKGERSVAIDVRMSLHKV